MNTIAIKVENLKCHGCANTITNGLKKFKEVEDVTVNVNNSTVKISFSGNDNEIERYKQKLAQLGYPDAGNNSGFSVIKSYVSCAKGRIHK